MPPGDPQPSRGDAGDLPHPICVAFGFKEPGSCNATGAVFLVLLIIVLCLLVVLVPLWWWWRRKRRPHSRKAPIGELAVVFTDLVASSVLWEVNQAMMDRAIVLHNKLVRKLVQRFGGYEVKKDGDTFMIVFPASHKAVNFCVECHEQLLLLDWPELLLEQENCKPVLDANSKLIQRGLRMRTGAHVGVPISRLDEVTEQMDYYGPVVNRAAGVLALAPGNQILVTAELLNKAEREAGWVSASMANLFRRQHFEKHTHGTFQLKGIQSPTTVVEILPSALVGRGFQEIGQPTPQLGASLREDGGVLSLATISEFSLVGQGADQHDASVLSSDAVSINVQSPIHQPVSEGRASLGGGVGPSTSAVRRVSVPEAGIPLDSKKRTPSFSDAGPQGARWQKGGLLGAGSFGRVYLGLNEDTGELMAVKQIPLLLEQEAFKKEADNMVHEVMLMHELVHPNIVRYIGVGIDTKEKLLNIFLEFVPGGSIVNLLSKFGRFNETLTSVYTRQLLQGLAYLHEHNIVHRDIKGGNILVANDGTIKLADFGSSKRLEGLVSESKSLHGTPYWMAPEVIRQKGYSHGADVWSVGCTVVEMLTGKHPWQNWAGQTAAMYNIAKENSPPPYPENLSDEARDFLDSCFKMDPSERPSATFLLCHPFVLLGSSPDLGSRLRPLEELPTALSNIGSSAGDAEEKRVLHAETSAVTLWSDVGMSTVDSTVSEYLSERMRLIQGSMITPGIKNSMAKVRRDPKPHTVV